MKGQETQSEINQLVARNDTIQIELSVLAGLIIQCNVAAACYSNQIQNLQGQQVKNDMRIRDLQAKLKKELSRD